MSKAQQRISESRQGHGRVCGAATAISTLMVVLILGVCLLLLSPSHGYAQTSPSFAQLLEAFDQFRGSGGAQLDPFISLLQEFVGPEAQSTGDAILNMVDLYEEAFLDEDVDQVDRLVAADLTPRVQVPRLTFIEQLTGYRDQAYKNFKIEDPAVLGPESRRVEVVQTVSVETPVAGRLVNQTKRFPFTLGVQQNTDPNGNERFQIQWAQDTDAAFKLVENDRLARPGQPLQLVVTSVDGSGTVDTADATAFLPVTGERVRLARDEDGRFRGSVLAPGQPGRYALEVSITGGDGLPETVFHTFRVTAVRPGTLERVSPPVRFLSVARDLQGTLWFGADGTEGNQVFRSLDGRTLQPLSVPGLNPAARIEDVVVDTRGRTHFIFFSPTQAGDWVHEPGGSLRLLIDVIGDADYPFRTASGQKSAITKGLADPGGGIWALGSDGGVALFDDRRTDRYAPLFTRANSAILANTVPAAAIAPDGALYFGTVFGISRYDGTAFEPLLFDPTAPVRGDVSTLESLFRAVANAIFLSRPVSAVGVGNLSFVDLFGAPLVKADLIFSAFADSRGRIWFGTLGGGLRLLSQGRFQTFRQSDGLIGNVIFSIAEDTDGDIWVATNEGATRLREGPTGFQFVDMALMDGLPAPVREIVVDPAGVKWFATDGGVYRFAGD